MDCLTESGALRVLNGELAARDREALEDHLNQCELCARLLGEAARSSEVEEVRWVQRLRPPVMAPGTIVAARYRIVRSIGSGAMGEVHEAEDQLLGKIVALKTLNAALMDRPGAIARLKSEVAMAHRVTHPNVCRIFDFGVDQRNDGQGTIVFLTMEYLPGETMAAFVRRRGSPPPAEALAMLREIAAGLAAAHDVGVIHRDLKPENVMLVGRSDRLRAVITDFGLAGSAANDRSVSAATRGFVGTFEYAAPERLAGRPATPSSDVYSFGLLAHQLLTGQLPPVASTAVVTAALRSGEPLAGAGSTARMLGPEWDSFVLRTLHPEPGRRYQDGGEVLAALSSTGLPGRSPRRRVGQAVVAVAALGALAGAALVVAPARPRPAVPIRAEVATPITTAAPPAREPPASPPIASPPVVATPHEPERRARPTSHVAKRKVPEQAAAAPSPAPPPEAPSAAASSDFIRELRPRPTAEGSTP